MATGGNGLLAQLIEKHRDALLGAWLDQQRGTNRSDAELSEVRDYSARFLDALRLAAGQFEDITAPSWSEARHVLEEVSRTRAQRGATPSQTAMFVFSLKRPLFDMLGREVGKDSAAFAREVWIATQLLDNAGPLHGRSLPEEPRGRDPAPTGRTARAVDAGRHACGTRFSRCR